MRYYCRCQCAAEFGPLTLDEIKQFASQGKLRHDDPVRIDSNDSWFDADRLPGVFSAPRPKERRAPPALQMAMVGVCGFAAGLLLALVWAAASTKLSREEERLGAEVVRLGEELRRSNEQIQALVRKLDGSQNQAQQLRAEAARMSPGLGISRTKLQGQLAATKLPKFEYEELLKNGRQQWFGKSNDNLTMIEIWGPENNVSQISLLVGLSENLSRRAQNIAYLMAAVNLLVPGYARDDAQGWLQHVASTIASGEPAVHRLGRIDFEMSLLKDLGFLMLTAKPVEHTQ